jgi:uncharacterized damage-inducible protein DinB
MEAMNRSALCSLHHYNVYANDLLLETAAKMTEAELTKKSSPSHDSVIGLLLHMLSVEEYFLTQCTGRPIPGSQDAPTHIGINELKALYASVAHEREHYLVEVTEDSLLEVIAVPIGSNKFNLPCWQLLAQSMLQSVHHRGELSIVMTELGYPLPTLDPILQYVSESGESWK